MKKTQNNEYTDVFEYAIGTIGADNVGIPVESQVVMSLNNFKRLLQLISIDNTGNNLVVEAQHIKDRLTTYNYNKNKTRQMLIDVLEEELNYHKFFCDVEQMIKLPSECTDITECV